MSDSKSSHGFFHTLKEKMFHGEKHVDTDYEAVYKKFQQLHDTMYKIKTSSANYASSVYSVFNHSNSTALDFSTLLEEATVSNPYQNLAIQTRTSHNRLNSDKQQQIANELTERVLKPIEEGLRNFGSLQQRIQKRNELHNDLEYYLNKVHGLSKDRDDRSMKGKSEKSSDLEKFDRNQQKLATARTEYQNFTSILMTDLNNAWNNRIALLGPCLASFVEAEKHFLEIYGNEINGVAKSDQLIQTPPHPIAPSPLAPGDLPTSVVQGDVQAHPVPGALAVGVAPQPVPSPNNMNQALLNEHEVHPAGGPGVSDANPFLQSPPHAAPPQLDTTGTTYVSNPAPPTGQGLQSDPNANPNPFAQSNVVIDPSLIAHEQQGYVHTSSTVPAPVSNKFEEDAKRQVEQEEKTFA